MSLTFFQNQINPEVLSTFFGSKSMFQPRQPEKYAPTFGEFYEIAGEETEWTPGENSYTLRTVIPPNGNRVKDIWFEFTMSAITAGAGSFDAGVDVLCFHDDLFYGMFEEARLVKGGKIYERVRLRPEHLREMHTEMDQRKNLYDERGWFGSEAACNAAARAAKTYRVKLPFEFCKEFYKSLRIDKLGNGVTIELKSNPKSQWTYSSDAGITSATFTITNFHMIMEYYLLSDSEISSLSANTLSFPYQHAEELSSGSFTASGAASTEHQIELNFQHPLRAFFVVLSDSTYDGYDKYWHSEDDTKIEKAALKADGKWKWEQLDWVWWTKILPSRIGYRANNNVGIFPATWALNSPVETSILDCSKLRHVYLHIWTTAAATFDYFIFGIVPNIMSYTSGPGGESTITSMYPR